MNFTTWFAFCVAVFMACRFLIGQFTSIHYDVIIPVFSVVSQQPSVGRPAPRPSLNQSRDQDRSQNGAFPPTGRVRPSYPAPAAPRQPPPSYGHGGGEFAFMFIIFSTHIIIK